MFNPFYYPMYTNALHICYCIWINGLKAASMERRVFDFTDFFRLRNLLQGQGQLAVLAGIDGFSSVVTGPDRQVLAVRGWNFDGGGRTFSAVEAALRKIFGSEDLLRNGYQEVRCSLFNANAQLTPRRLFRPNDDLSHHFQLLLDPNDYQYGYQELPGLDTYLVWATERLMPNLFQQYFPGCRHSHLFAAVVYGFSRQTDPEGVDVMVNLRNNVMQVVVFERKNLLFANTYFFHHTNDALYFMLLAYDQFRLRTTEVTLTLAGQIFPDSELYRQLYRYVRHVRFAQLPGGLTLPPDMRTMPDHFYFDLFCTML